MINCSKIKKQYKNVIKEERKEHNQNWPEIPDLPHRILLIIGDYGFGKTNL